MQNLYQRRMSSYKTSLMHVIHEEGSTFILNYFGKLGTNDISSLKIY